jgi:hypothetical protein
VRAEPVDRALLIRADEPRVTRDIQEPEGVESVLRARVRDARAHPALVAGNSQLVPGRSELRVGRRCLYYPT